MSKWALISPNEIVEQGFRVAYVCDKRFDVAKPLYWWRCNDTVSADLYYFDGITFIEKPTVNHNNIVSHEVIIPTPQEPPINVA